MADRNPSPPRLSAEEIKVIQCDNIGETVFSKKWVLGVLMKLVQSVQRVTEGSQESENVETSEDGVSFTVLDNSFERELCELWDMSMNVVSNVILSLLLDALQLEDI